MLLLNPASNEALRREKEEGEPNIRGIIRNWLMVLEQHLGLPPEKLGDIVRLYNYAPSNMIIRYDNTMYVLHYVHSRTGNSPTEKLQATPGGLFEIYLEHFERTWTQAQPFQGVDKLNEQ